MARGRLEVEGHIELDQFWPVGSSDADTSKVVVSTTANSFRFRPDAAAPFKVTKAFASAPEILFVTAAGNSNSDASFVEDIPAGIALPNLLSVGAVDKAGDEASFTSYGPTVKVHANGYQVDSVIPGGDKLAESGTSMASPQVTNLAAKILAVAPRLSPTEVIDLIVTTAERTPDGRRVLVNPKKALEAAQARRRAA